MQKIEERNKEENNYYGAGHYKRTMTVKNNYTSLTYILIIFSAISFFTPLLIEFVMNMVDAIPNNSVYDQKDITFYYLGELLDKNKSFMDSLYIKIPAVFFLSFFVYLSILFENITNNTTSLFHIDWNNQNGFAPIGLTILIFGIPIYFLITKVAVYSFIVCAVLSLLLAVFCCFSSMNTYIDSSLSHLNEDRSYKKFQELKKECNNFISVMIKDEETMRYVISLKHTTQDSVEKDEASKVIKAFEQFKAHNDEINRLNNSVSSVFNDSKKNITNS